MVLSLPSPSRPPLFPSSYLLPAILPFPSLSVSPSGRSDLAVACLTAVREVLGSNRDVGSCVYRKNHCDLQPWARHGLCAPFLRVMRVRYVRSARFCLR